MDAPQRTQRDILAAMTPEERLRQAFALRQMAWNLKAAWIRQTQPELSEEQVQDVVRRAFLYART
jgi:hypothetical protein